MNSVDAWSKYWSSGVLESCVVSGADRESLVRHWVDVAKMVSDNQMVLDLATGNGFTAYQIAKANPAIQVTGVDRAKIITNQIADANHSLSNLTLIGDINIEQLPFTDDTFQLVTSNFGIEYSNMEVSIPEASRILKPYGNLVLLLHSSDSAVLLSSTRKKRELKFITTSGLFNQLQSFVSGKSTFQAMESVIREVSNNESIAKSQELTGNILKAISRILKTLSVNSGLGKELADDLEQRVNAELSRLEQQHQAALDTEGVEALSKLMRDHGFTDVQITDMKTGPHSDKLKAGWLLTATKSNHSN